MSVAFLIVIDGRPLMDIFFPSKKDAEQTAIEMSKGKHYASSYIEVIRAPNDHRGDAMQRK